MFMDTIESEAIANKLKDFFNTYYEDQINEMFISYPKKRSLLVDLKDLEKFDVDLSDELSENPDSIVPIANQTLQKRNPNPNAKETVYLRFFGSEVNMPLI